MSSDSTLDPLPQVAEAAISEAATSAAETQPDPVPAASEFYAPPRVLIIVAHADDIEFGSAGTVARWTEAGSEVTYCIVTDNGSGSNEPGVKRADLVERRRREQIAAAEILGVRDVRFLNYPDGYLEPTLALRRDLTRIIREVRPQIVLTMDPTTTFIDEVGYINHPDHRAVGEAAIHAVFPSAGTRLIFPELLDEGLEPHNVSRLYLTVATKANLIVDVTAVFERKLESLRQHASQLNEEAFEMITRWGAEEGARHGMGYAESFRVLVMDSNG
ncbi:MAG: PIG-L deacetylase family protein [bacterium]|nr:PIG-L deacetylase family protein [bacterium]